MLVEKSREDALKAFLSGKRVVAIFEFDDGSMNVHTISDLLPDQDMHYLVDLPAAEDPEFSKTVRDMVKHGEEISKSEKNDIASPPPHDFCRNRGGGWSGEKIEERDRPGIGQARSDRI